MQLEEFKKTILSQYSNAFKMIYLLERFNDAIDPEKDLKRFYDDVFNLDTCGAYGLKVWGRIVAAPQTIDVEETDYLGFDGQELSPFDNAPFYGEQPAMQTVTIGNELYRRLIYFKAYVNIMQTTLPEIDKALWMLFGDSRGPKDDIYTQEHIEGVMTMRIIFRFSLSAIERAILRTYGYLLRPGGVGLKLYEIPYNIFGFQGSDLLPFDQGTFWSTLIGDLNSTRRNSNAI